MTPVRNVRIKRPAHFLPGIVTINRVDAAPDVITDTDLEALRDLEDIAILASNEARAAAFAIESRIRHGAKIESRKLTFDRSLLAIDRGGFD